MKQNLCAFASLWQKTRVTSYTLILCGEIIREFVVKTKLNPKNYTLFYKHSI